MSLVNIGAIAGKIGGLVDRFTGGDKGSKVAGIVGKVAGMGGGGVE